MGSPIRQQIGSESADHGGMNEAKAGVLTDDNANAPAAPTFRLTEDRLNTTTSSMFVTANMPMAWATQSEFHRAGLPGLLVTRGGASLATDQYPIRAP